VESSVEMLVVQRQSPCDQSTLISVWAWRKILNSSSCGLSWSRIEQYVLPFLQNSNSTRRRFLEIRNSMKVDINFKKCQVSRSSLWSIILLCDYCWFSQKVECWLAQKNTSVEGLQYQVQVPYYRCHTLTLRLKNAWWQLAISMFQKPVDVQGAFVR
jgi:hypothetical protein